MADDTSQAGRRQLVGRLIGLAQTWTVVARLLNGCRVYFTSKTDSDVVVLNMRDQLTLQLAPSYGNRRPCSATSVQLMLFFLLCKLIAQLFRALQSIFTQL